MRLQGLVLVRFGSDLSPKKQCEQHPRGSQRPLMHSYATGREVPDWLELNQCQGTKPAGSLGVGFPRLPA